MIENKYVYLFAHGKLALHINNQTIPKKIN